jgi:hypothetical protein
MEMGGFGGYSKYKVISKFPPHLIPKTLLVDAAASTPEAVLKLVRQHNIAFPLIIKPDVGERGWKVEKIADAKAFSQYLGLNRLKLLIQEYINYPLELGIMYHRLPGQSLGQITSVVQKEFLFVQGDGKSTLLQLLRQFTRTRYHLPMLLELYKQNLHTVIPQGEVLELVSIGNHCRGATFLNANYLITPALTEVFNYISKQIDGFYFGRYDIRVASLDDLYAGQNIKILELNGANSEPAHIYDPQMPILQAYKHLFSHWRTLFDISIHNHKNGVPFTSFRQGIAMIWHRKSPYYVAASSAE